MPDPDLRGELGPRRADTPPRGRWPRWALPALAATVGVAVVIGAAAATSILGLRDVAHRPSASAVASLVSTPSPSSPPIAAPAISASPVESASATPSPVPTATLAGAASPTPRFDAATGLLAHTVENNVLWVAEPGGANGVQLATTPAIHRIELAWSHDGALLAFGEIVDADRKTIEVIAADGSGRRTVADMVAYDLAWAPESNRLAIAGDSGVWIVNTDTGELTAVGGFGRHAIEWSPSGRYVAWLSSGPGANAVAVHDTVSAETRTVPIAAQWVSAMTWHPDEQHLLVAADDAAHQPVLSTVDIKTGAVEAHPSGLRVMRVGLSPDGRWVSYVAPPDATGSPNVGVVSIGDGTVIPLVATVGAIVHWAADSTALLVSQSGTVRRVWVDGSSPDVIAYGYDAVQQPLR